MGDLENTIDLMWHTIKKCKANYNAARYLNYPDNEEVLTFVIQSDFFYNVAYSLWKLCIIDLHKIYSRSNGDKISLDKLMKNLENKHYANHKIPFSNINEWKDEIRSCDQSIKKVYLMRNKFYAHTDLNPVEVNLYFLEVANLISLAEKILNSIITLSFDPNGYSDYIGLTSGEREIALLLRLKKEKVY